jgi:hypothetical protein
MNQQTHSNGGSLALTINQSQKEKKMKIISMKTSFIALIFVLVSLCVGCKKDESTQNTPAASNNPEIVGCNSVKYNGYTFTNLGCQPGIASFDVSGTQNGHAYSFHITCSNGCVSSVTLK